MFSGTDCIDSCSVCSVHSCSQTVFAIHSHVSRGLLAAHAMNGSILQQRHECRFVSVPPYGVRFQWFSNDSGSGYTCWKLAQVAGLPESLNLELQTKGATRSGSSCADLMSQSTRCAFRALVPWSWSLMFKFRVQVLGLESCKHCEYTSSIHLPMIDSIDNDGWDDQSFESRTTTRKRCLLPVIGGGAPFTLASKPFKHRSRKNSKP